MRLRGVAHRGLLIKQLRVPHGTVAHYTPDGERHAQRSGQPVLPVWFLPVDHKISGKKFRVSFLEVTLSSIRLSSIWGYSLERSSLNVTILTFLYRTRPISLTLIANVLVAVATLVMFDDIMVSIFSFKEAFENRSFRS